MVKKGITILGIIAVIVLIGYVFKVTTPAPQCVIDAYGQQICTGDTR